jgi:hypothetical protein
MVYDTNLTLFYHRTIIFPDLLVLSQAMAIDICTQNDAERYVVTFLLGSIRIEISFRLLPARGTCSPGVFWMDCSNYESV